MLMNSRGPRTGRLPFQQSYLRHLREAAIIVGAYFAYLLLKNVIIPNIEAVALANAAKVVSFQLARGFLWEPDWQQWAVHSSKALVVFFNWAYIITFFPIILTTAVILYVKDRAKYSYYRNVVLLSFVFALLLFALFPLAPPRFLPEYGFIDAIQRFGPTWYASREVDFYYNAFAAMPSLHFGWTVLFGVLFFRTSKPWLKVLGVAYPILTFFAITVTGNHYTIDAAGGATVILASFLLYEVLRRRRVRALPLRAAVKTLLRPDSSSGRK